MIDEKDMLIPDILRENSHTTNRTPKSLQDPGVGIFVSGFSYSNGFCGFQKMVEEEIFIRQVLAATDDFEGTVKSSESYYTKCSRIQDFLIFSGCIGLWRRR